MDSETRVKLHRQALAGMQESRPKDLLRALSFYAGDETPPVEVDPRDFQDALQRTSPADGLLELWRRYLAQWDAQTDPAWSSARAKSGERRAEVMRLLGLDGETAQLLTDLLPVTTEPSATVISREHVPWYTDERRKTYEWYWPRYRQLLLEKGWPAESVAGLDEATTDVVARLADPSAEHPYGSKGLVVGYVQSGKTANFTGVIAKAIDAGYRLVIVLGGTLNLLRAQTQRRLDMELVGKENILRGVPEDESEYGDDPAWIKGEFISFDALPSELGGFDIYRMTTHERDYEKLLQGIVALEHDKSNTTLPLYHPSNLRQSAARLMVVKKNKSVLDKLVGDLKRLTTPLDQIPTLIIDDESDEASVNTRRRDKPDVERTAINQSISDLLGMLHRAQYVGYTATPFANVFIDPSDSEDIFPNDFIISLPRPIGYMGAEDFHDLELDIPYEERNFANSNEKAYVRSIYGDDEEDDSRLREAIDMFVLTAAVKLYRRDHGASEDAFRHHTMLVHESVRTAAHRELARTVTKLWFDSSYSGPAGHERLGKLFESDLAPVCRARADGLPVPNAYQDLSPYISRAITLIGGDDQPVIVVNSDKDVENRVADFDKRAIWKIVIGGNKLSRGFTVEGLTISYYRRRTNNASTLMQMGRWFGFRKGYQDLVRLYVGRMEGKLRGQDIDLYEAFEAICRDEKLFREQLSLYATPVDGKRQITPAQVPPLVSQHLTWLKPTAPNKMYNAKLEELCSPGRWEEPTAYPSRESDLRSNMQCWTPILNSLSRRTETFTGREIKVTGATSDHSFPAYVALIAHDSLLEALVGLKWGASGIFSPNLRYLKEIGDNSQVDDWLVLAPQLSTDKRLRLESRELSWFARERRRETRFGAISDPKHRPAALRIAGASHSIGDPISDGYAKPKRGVVCLYPVVEPKHRGEIGPTGELDPGKIVMAFCFVAPAEAVGRDRRLVRFTTIDSSRADDPIVPARAE